jgi:hypothetical protein
MRCKGMAAAALSGIVCSVMANTDIPEASVAWPMQWGVSIASGLLADAVCIGFSRYA